MNGLLPEVTRRCLESRSELALTATGGAVVVIGLLVLLVAREVVRALRPGPGAARTALRRYDVAVVSLLLVVAVVVAERFRLLA